MPFSLVRISPALLGAILVPALGIALVCPAFAEDSTGSLDNLWSEQPSTTASPSVSTSAPMVSVSAFKESSLVQRGAWPGLGPFSSSSELPYDMVDNNQNRLRIKVSDDKITEAQLQIVKEKPVAQDFLDLQMSADFLLEAVGVKAKKIADFNKEIEKNKEQVLKLDGKPLDLPVGRYLVSFQRQPIAGQDKFSYLIRINSQDASRDVIKEHSEPAETAVVTPPPEPTPVVVAEPPQPTDEQLKETFAQVIRNWQKVKKAAVRERQTAELGEVLAGRALTRQTDAVKWLSNNKKYYEMNPRGVSVENLTQVQPGKKYAVFALVREASKYIDEATGHTLKESDDTYKVNYTLEKMGERWLITDSAIVPAVSPDGKSNSSSRASR